MPPPHLEEEPEGKPENRESMARRVLVGWGRYRSASSFTLDSSSQSVLVCSCQSARFTPSQHVLDGIRTKLPEVADSC